VFIANFLKVGLIVLCPAIKGNPMPSEENIMIIIQFNLHVECILAQSTS
jgi:hypothetical protein